jgi:hypothetical protein
LSAKTSIAVEGLTDMQISAIDESLRNKDLFLGEIIACVNNHEIILNTYLNVDYSPMEIVSDGTVNDPNNGNPCNCYTGFNNPECTKYINGPPKSSKKKPCDWIIGSINANLKEERVRSNQSDYYKWILAKTIRAFMVKHDAEIKKIRPDYMGDYSKIGDNGYDIGDPLHDILFKTMSYLQYQTKYINELLLVPKTREMQSKYTV